MHMALSVLQVLPALAYFALAIYCRHAFWRAWNRQPLAFDLIEVPIFFASLGIAYNIGWALAAGTLGPPSSTIEAVGRVLGMLFHLACAYKLMEGVRTLRGYAQ